MSWSSETNIKGPPGGLGEAPQDGQTYGRNNAVWTTVQSSGGSAGTGEWTFNSTTTTPPGSGQVRFNNATQVSATRVYVSDTTAPGSNVGTLFRYQMKTGSKIYIQDKDNAGTWILFQTTADATDGGGYSDVAVSYVNGAGTIPAQRVIVTLSPAGAGGGGAASGITVTPAGNIASTNVQAALQELDTEKVAKAGDTMTGNLLISKANPSYVLQKTASGQANQIAGYNDINPRWSITLGDSAAESGSNAGSNFGLYRFTDAGAQIDAPLTVARSSGVVNFIATPTVNGTPMSGGSGVPGGANTQIQFNDSGAFGGGANLAWNKTTSVLTVTGQLSISLGNATSIVAAGVIEAGSGFKQTGTNVTLSPASAGSVLLRPGGPASSTGQIQLTTTSVTSNSPIVLPADPTTALQAATKQYVDVHISSPQGRLTLQSAVPVMVTTQAAKTTIYYSPYNGNAVPIYNGTIMISTLFGEISVLTTDTAKNPAAIGASKVNDWFIWNDAGTIRLSHGPDWTSDTARSAGTALTRVNGILTNAVAITNGPGVSLGTYVGTTRSNASSQLDWIYAVDGAPPTPGFFGVWNAYNRATIATQVHDTTATWAYALNVVREPRGDTGTYRTSFVTGLQEDAFTASYTSHATNPGSGGYAVTGIGYDNATAFTGAASSTNQIFSATTFMHSKLEKTADLGFHFVTALEFVSAAVSATFQGNNLYMHSYLNFNHRM